MPYLVFNEIRQLFFFVLFPAWVIIFCFMTDYALSTEIAEDSQYNMETSAITLSAIGLFYFYIIDNSALSMSVLFQTLVALTPIFSLLFSPFIIGLLHKKENKFTSQNQVWIATVVLWLTTSIVLFFFLYSTVMDITNNSGVVIIAFIIQAMSGDSGGSLIPRISIYEPLYILLIVLSISTLVLLYSIYLNDSKPGSVSDRWVHFILSFAFKIPFILGFKIGERTNQKKIKQIYNKADSNRPNLSDSDFQTLSQIIFSNSLFAMTNTDKTTAAKTLGKLSSEFPNRVQPYITKLIGQTSSSNHSIYTRREACKSLRYIAHTSPELIEPHIESISYFLGNEDKWIRSHAAWTLAAIADTSPGMVIPHIDELGECLDDSHPMTRENAAYALGSIASEYPESVSHLNRKLILCLDDSSEGVRIDAARALTNLPIDEDARKKAIDELSDLLDYERSHMQRRVINLLGDFQAISAIPTLYAQLNEESDEELKEHIQSTINSIKRRKNEGNNKTDEQTPETNTNRDSSGKNKQKIHSDAFEDRDVSRNEGKDKIIDFIKRKDSIDPNERAPGK